MVSVACSSKSNLFSLLTSVQGRLMTPPIEVDEVTTPDVPSSSPCLDPMDVSPLPHKPPYFIAQVTLPSPTPESTPDPDDVISPDLLCPDDQPVAQPLPVLAPSPLQSSEYEPSPGRCSPLTDRIH
jgi:hypothetical protein